MNPPPKDEEDEEERIKNMIQRNELPHEWFPEN